ncbi:MAG: glycosyltransferase [Synechococcales bacterium]|nr:glycosyltransferase [Synechococcales bacterium]
MSASLSATQESINLSTQTHQLGDRSIASQVDDLVNSQLDSGVKQLAHSSPSMCGQSFVKAPIHISERQPVIGYLMKSYPKISETFILNEILELERQGIQLHLFSLRPCPDAKSHPDVSKVKAPVTYIPLLRQNKGYSLERLQHLASAQLYWLKKFPDRSWQAFEFYKTQSLEWEDFLQAAFLAKTLSDLQITHVQVHFANLPTAIVEIAQYFYPFTFNIFAHAKDIYLTPKGVLNRRMEKAEFVLTCTGFNAQYLREMSNNDTPIYLSYHGLNLERFTPKRSPGEMPTQVPLMLSVGRFCEKKGFPYLLQACACLKQMGCEFRCVIVGYGEMRSQLEAMIHDLNLSDTVTLSGKKTQDELVELYHQSSLFVLPCLVTDDGDRDGIPNVLLEAMAMKLPVVSTNISGISELVEDQFNGFLIPEKDAAALTEALSLLLNNPDLRQEFGIRGRQKVLQQFNLEKNVAEIREQLVLAVSTTHSSHHSY